MGLHLFVWVLSHRQSAIVKQDCPLNRSLLRNPRARTFNARTLNNPLSPSVPPSGQFPQDFGVYFRSKVRPESVFTAMTDPYCTSNDPLRASVFLFFPLWADYPIPMPYHQTLFGCFSLCGRTTPLFYAAKILEPLRRLKAN